MRNLLQAQKPIVDCPLNTHKQIIRDIKFSKLAINFWYLYLAIMSFYMITYAI